MDDKRAKILIVEDDPDMVEALKVMLESKGYLVINSLDPEEGFQKVRDERPNLVILDVMFGSKQKTEGFELAQRIKGDKELARIPILMLTAVNVQHPQFGFSPQTDGEYLPVDDFIDKPTQPEELLKKVEDLLKLNG
jgi:DNA-binding response OmpR family regulator